MSDQISYYDSQLLAQIQLIEEQIAKLRQSVRSGTGDGRTGCACRLGVLCGYHATIYNILAEALADLDRAEKIIEKGE